MITGIVVALPEEAGTLIGLRLNKGECFKLSAPLLLVYSGAGEANAQRAAELLIAQGAVRLISWGCAAALSPSLKAGDLVLADTFLSADNELIDGNSLWRKHTQQLLAQMLPVYGGCLLESKQLVALSADKQRLYETTKAVALDMETLAVAKIAAQHQLPFLAIRAIADPVTMDLPQAVSYALNEQGDVVLTRLLRYLLVHPSELPKLIQLGLHFHRAKKTLTQVAPSLEKIAEFRT